MRTCLAYLSCCVQIYKSDTTLLDSLENGGYNFFAANCEKFHTMPKSIYIKINKQKLHHSSFKGALFGSYINHPTGTKSIRVSFGDNNQFTLIGIGP